MQRDGEIIPVIQTGAFRVSVCYFEPCGADDVEVGVHPDALAGNITGVGRDRGLVEGNVNHAQILETRRYSAR